MLFVAVAGEETGLLGSKHFVENPIVPLSNIKYVLNFDMIADNSEDIYVEISEEGQKGLDLFNEINSDNSFFTELEQGELAGNSDHFSFAEKDVPAVCFLMKGDGFKIYHTPQDNFQSIDLNSSGVYY
jgi:Zn-dependent M28 family amino/carboxypeptidase